VETEAVSSRDHHHLFENAEQIQRKRASEKTPDHLTQGTEQLAKNSLQQSNSPEEQKEVEKLQARDREVRAREQARKAAAAEASRRAAEAQAEILHGSEELRTG